MFARSGRHRYLALAALLLGVAGCGSATGKQPSPPLPHVPPDTPAAAVRSTNTLALDLLARTAPASADTVFSPYSVQAALAMIDAGAAGETASQIERVLDASGAPALAASNAALATRLAASTALPHGATPADGARLNLAGALWTQSGLALKPPFTQTLSGAFGAPPQTVDFQAHPEAARTEINAWIAQRTSQLIQNLMPPGSITAQTALVLANAIYLKAHWSHPFDPAGTASGTFFTQSGAGVKTPFMTQPPTLFYYGGGPAYQAIELPYLNSALSMLLVMPSPGTLERFQQRLSVGSLSRIDQSLAPQMIDLRLPRFHLLAHFELNSLLSELGMPLAFNDSADFSGITAQTPLKIAAVEHGADLKVDEFGTVATAATGISVNPTAVAPSPARRVTLDHPFLLFLRDHSSGAILFAGRVANPTRG